VVMVLSAVTVMLVLGARVKSGHGEDRGSLLTCSIVVYQLHLECILVVACSCFIHGCFVSDCGKYVARIVFWFSFEISFFGIKAQPPPPGDLSCVRFVQT